MDRKANLEIRRPLPLGKIEMAHTNRLRGATQRKAHLKIISEFWAESRSVEIGPSPGLPPL